MSSLTHEATIKLNLDFVDSAGLRKLEASLEAIKTALDLTRFNEKWEALNNTINEQRQEIDRLNQSLTKQVEVRAKITAATKKEQQAAALLANSRKNTLSKDWSQYRMDPSFDPSKRGSQTLGLPAGLAGNWKSAMQGMASNVKTFKTELADATNISSQLARGLTRLTVSMEATEDAVRAGRRAFADVGRTMEQGKASVKIYRNEMAALQAQYDEIGKAAKAGAQVNVAALRQIENAVKSLMAREAQHTSRMKSELAYRISHYEKQVDAIHRAAFRISMAGANLTQFARSIFQTGMRIMDTFGEYEFELNRAAGALSIWQDSVIEGQDGTEMLSQSILDLAGGLKIIPAREAAEAMYYWGSATGQAIESSEQLATNMGALEAIMKASIMTNTSYEDTIKGVYSILTQFYNGAISEADEVTEKLFYVTQKTAVEFNDLIQAFKMVGPVAAQNNVTFDEMVSIFGRLGDLGIRGSMAGRAFRQMFIQLVRPSGPAKKAIENLFNSVRDNIAEFEGKSYTQLIFPEGEFIGIEGYIRNLALAMDTLTQSERNAFLGRISTANELPVITALIADATKELRGLSQEQDKTQSLATDSALYFERNWARFSGTWKATVGEMQRAFESLQITVGSVVAKAMAPFLDKAREVIAMLREWAESPANRGIIDFIAKVGAGIAVMSAFAGAVLTVGGVLTGLAASAYVIVKAFGQYVPMFAVFSGAIFAFIDGIIRNFDMLSEAIGQTVEDFRLASGEGTDALGALQAIMEGLAAPTRVVVDAIMSLVAGIIRLAGVVGRMIGDFEVLVPVLKAISTVIGVIVAARMAAWVLGLAKLIGAWKVFKALNIVGMLATIGRQTAVANGATAVAAKNMGAMRMAGSGLASVLGGPLGIVGAMAAIGAIAYEVFPPFKDFIDDITSSFVSLTDKIADATAKLGELGAGVRNTAENYARRTLGDAETIFQSGSYKKDEEGKEHFVITMGGREVKLSAWDTKEGLRAEIQALLDAETLAIVQTVNDHYAQLNQELAKTQQVPIDMSTFVDKMTNIQSLLPKGHNPLDVSQILMNTYGQHGLAISKNEIASIIDSIPQTASLNEAIQAAIVNVLFDPSSVDAADRKMASDKWSAYVGKMVKWLGDSTISDKEIFARYQNPAALFSWGSAPSGALQDFVSSLDEGLQKQFMDAWSARFGTADIETNYTDSLKSGFASRYTALADAAASAMYEGYEEAETASKGAYDKAMEGLITQNLDMTVEAVLGLEESLRNRALAPEAYEAWVKVMEVLVAKGLLDLTTYNSIKKQIAPKVAEEVLTMAQQITKDVTELIAEGEPDSVAKIQQALVSLGNVRRAGGDTGSEIARNFFKAVVMPLLVGAEMDDESKKAISAYLEHFISEGLMDPSILADFNSGKLQRGFWGNLTTAINAGAATGIIPPAEMLRRAMFGKAGAVTQENADKSKRDWLDEFIGNVVPTEKDLREALKRIKSGGSRQRASFNILDNKWLKRLLGSRTGEEREFGKDTADNIINGIVAQFNAAGGTGRRGRSIMRQVVKMINDPNTPDYIRKQLERHFRTALQNVDIDVPDTFKPDQFMNGLYATMGIEQSGEGTTEKKPKKVFLRVVVSQTGSNKTRDVVLRAKDKIAAAITAINEMPWLATGSKAASLLKTGFVSGLNTPVFKGAAFRVLAKFREVGWWDGGNNAGTSWARGFNAAVRSEIDKTLTFVASVTIGGSPPPYGPLKDIDRGGANAGTAWGDGFGKAARDRMMAHAHRMREESYSERMGLVTEQTYNNKKEISIHMDVSSKDGSVDRAKQGEFRRGAMDALVAADLEHYVTVS